MTHGTGPNEIGRPRRAHVDERGLIGKVLLLILVIVVLSGVAAVDAGSIVLTHVRVADIAQDAAFAGGERFAETASRRQAVRAALAAIDDRDDDARMQSLRISSEGAVTVEVEDRAWSLLAGRLGFLRLDGIVMVTATQTHDGATG